MRLRRMRTQPVFIFFSISLGGIEQLLHFKYYGVRSSHIYRVSTKEYYARRNMRTPINHLLDPFKETFGV